MTISKFRALDHAAKELKDYCNQFKDCDDCLFEKEYLKCPFRRASVFPYMWEFKKRCKEEGMTRHGKWETNKVVFMKTCSLCGKPVDQSHDYNFCPECGAKMDLEGE